MSTSLSPLLSESQIAALAKIGEERSAAVGDLLYQVGDRPHSLMVVLEGAVSITDTSGNELIRHGPSDFVGELNLLTGQTVFVNAVVVESLRFIAVERDALRALLNENGQLSDLLLSAFMARREALQQVQGVGGQVIGPSASETSREVLEFLRANRPPYTPGGASAPNSNETPLGLLPGRGEPRKPS